MGKFSEFNEKLCQHCWHNFSITIIVLLILAGVSISMVVGQNGILNRATNAAEQTTEADIKSALQTAISGAQGDFIDAWNKDQKLTFMDWLKKDTNYKSLEPEGYTVVWTDEANRTAGTIAKGNTKFSFTLEAKGTYGADISGWTKVTE